MGGGGVWGHAPPEFFFLYIYIDPLRLILGVLAVSSKWKSTQPDGFIWVVKERGCGEGVGFISPWCALYSLYYRIVKEKKHKPVCVDSPVVVGWGGFCLDILG